MSTKKARFLPQQKKETHIVVADGVDLMVLKIRGIDNMNSCMKVLIGKSKREQG